MQCQGFKPLKQGSVVELVVLATACSKEEYEKSIALVESMGLVAKYAPYEQAVQKDALACANTPQYRLESWYKAQSASDVDAVWCINGGYGTPQMLEGLSQLKTPKTNPVLIGFSDITVLLNHLVGSWNKVCIHGAMLKQMATGQVSEATIKQVKALLFGQLPKVDVSDVTALNQTAKKGDVVSGKMLGGCLSLFQVLVGTPQMPDVTGAVLLLEDDRFETPQRVDRILDHLSRAGVFDKVGGVVLGNFLESPQAGSEDEKGILQAFERIAQVLDRKKVPLVHSPKLGHGYDMLSIPLGTTATLTLGKKCALTLDAGYC